MRKCKQCGKKCEGDYCFSHKPRKTLSQRRFVFRTDDIGHELIRKAMQVELFFQGIWNRLPHKSEISEEYLGKEMLSIYFHHILSKSKYPDLELIEENIILLTLDEHTNVESDMYKYEEINTRRKLLKAKYNI